jgi:hypothetical protein
MTVETRPSVAPEKLKDSQLTQLRALHRNGRSQQDDNRSKTFVSPEVGNKLLADRGYDAD